MFVFDYGSASAAARRDQPKKDLFPRETRLSTRDARVNLARAEGVVERKKKIIIRARA